MEAYILFAPAFMASAAAPGPDIAALVARALSAGARSSAGLLAGIIVGKLVLLTLALLGLAVLVQALGPLFVVVKLGGAAYLVWLGIQTWRRAGRTLEGTATPSRGLLADAALGLGMALANPIAVLFYVALLPSVIDVGGVTLGRGLTLGAIIVGAMGVIGGGYILLAHAARRLFTTPAAKRRIDRGAGAVLIGAGVAVAAR